MPSSWTTLRVDDVPMQTYTAVPEGPGPFPGVVVAMHISGVDNFTQYLADRLAQGGYVAAAPDLYHRQEEDISFEELITLESHSARWQEVIRPRANSLLDDEMERDLDAAFDYLRALPQVGDSPIGVAGTCMGGRISYLYATRNPRLVAAVSCYGSNILIAKGDGPSPFAASHRIACPVLGLFGEDDGNPTMEDVARIDAELTRVGVEHDFHSYAGAGHGFMNPHNAEAFREQASRDAWPRIYAFLDEKLKARVPAS